MPVKKTNSKKASPSSDRIERPHSGSSTRLVGSQTPADQGDLSGAYGRRGGSVRQVGPTDITKAGNGGSGSVRRVGEATYEDGAAVGSFDAPYSRQSGSVKQIGSADIEYGILTGTGGPAPQAISGRPSSGDTVVAGTPLLKSGVGRTHDWSKFAGQPGTISSRDKVVNAGATSGSFLIDGRRGGFSIESSDDDLVEPTGDSIVPGS